MIYREAKKLKIGNYAIPKHMGDKPPELYNSNKGKFDTTTGK